MESNELIKRYIYAATRRLPEKLRRDVAQELQSIISDMLEARCGDLVPSEKDVKVVLTELGTPKELEQKYLPHASEGLLSGLYYTTWLLVMKIVLLCVSVGITIASVIKAVTEGSAWYVALCSWLAGLFGSAMIAFAFLTLMFAVFQRARVPMESVESSLDALPPVPVQNLVIKRGEAIFNLILNGLFAVVFLAFHQVVIIGIFEGSGPVPVFDIAVLRSCWPWIAAMAALGILVESMKLLERRYTKRLIAVNVGATLLTLLCAGFWLHTPNLINAQFAAHVQGLFDGSTQWLTWFFSNLPQALFLVITFACVLEIGTTLWKLRAIRA